MRFYRRVLFVVVFVVTGAPHAHARTDMSQVTCGAFLASGQTNMAAAIMWLRGYHAGKRGVIDVIDKPPADTLWRQTRPLLQGSPLRKCNQRLRAGSCRTSIAAFKRPNPAECRRSMVRAA
ncbi:MAG: hypothetical protein E6G83_06350 [Alphaproteobacteria bacterium]|nr:MAG: hypothetical protein E6G83_06350 [Alphaproteobacteria bacterium]